MMKNIIYKTLSPVLLLSLFACTSSIETVVKDISPAYNGVPKISKVGETMLVKGKLKVLPGFKIKDDHYLPKVDDVILPLAHKGDIWSCIGKTTDGSLVCRFPDSISSRIIMADGSMPQGKYSLLFKPWGEVSGLMSPTGKVLSIEASKSLAGLFETEDIALDGTHKEEIVYNGKFDDMIKMTFQVYEHDLSKPSYFKGLSYNIGSLNTVRIQDSVIEVLSADENQIKFIVRN